MALLIKDFQGFSLPVVIKKINKFIVPIDLKR